MPFVQPSNLTNLNSLFIRFIAIRFIRSHLLLPDLTQFADQPTDQLETRRFVSCFDWFRFKLKCVFCWNRAIWIELKWIFAVSISFRISLRFKSLLVYIVNQPHPKTVVYNRNFKATSILFRSVANKMASSCDSSGRSVSALSDTAHRSHQEYELRTKFRCRTSFSSKATRTCRTDKR